MVNRTKMLTLAKNMENSEIDKDTMLEIVDKELDTTQKATYIEYLETIEHIEGILSAVEKEKDLLMEETDNLNLLVNSQAVKLSQLSKENAALQSAYDSILHQTDLLSAENNNLLKEKEALESNLSELKSQSARIQLKETQENEQKVKELSFKVERLAKDNRNLQDRLNSIMSLRDSSEDMNLVTLTQLNDMNSKYKLLMDENDKLRIRLDIFFAEKSNLASILEQRVHEIEDLKREFKYEYDRIKIEHANIVKELQDQLKQKEEEYQSGNRSEKELVRDQNTGLFFAESNMCGLVIDEDIDPFNNNQKKRMSINDYLQREAFPQISERDINTIPSSTRDIATSDQFIVEQDIKYLEELEEKDKEITSLREQMADLREKMSKGTNDNPKHEEKVKKLTMDLKHINEKYDMLKDNSENEKINLETALRNIEEAYVHLKLKTQLESADKDEEMLRLKKQTKLLTYQIGLYEDQIREFNTNS